MAKNIIWGVVVLLFLQFCACQYPVGSSELPDAKKFLVIDAEISETYAKLNVTYTLTDVNSNGAYLLPTPPKATAYLEDSKGNRYDLLTDGTVDSLFRGVVGETYKLYVQADGKSYESTPETIRSSPELDSLTPIYTRESFRDPGDLNYDGFDVYAQFNDIPGEENYYQWDWIHYERIVSCDRVREGDHDVRIPCNTPDCWSIKHNTRVIIQTDKLRDGRPIAQRVVRVPYAIPPNKYYLRVEQRSITPSVYAYLQSVETQTQNIGSIFDVPAQTRFNPNVHNVNDPSERILGVFSVFSARHKIIYIDMRQKIEGAQAKNIADPTPLTSNPLASAPCVEGQYRTQKKPEGWVD